MRTATSLRPLTLTLTLTQVAMVLLVPAVLGACGVTTGPPRVLPGDEDAGEITGEDLADPGSDEDLAGQVAQGDMAMGGGKGDMAMGGGMPACKVLTITPADTTLLVDGVHSFGVKYQALCGAFDVSAFATWSIDDAKLGGFNMNAFVSAPAGSGTSTVRAAYTDGNGPVVMASTSLTLKVTTAVVAPNTPMNAPNQFGGKANPALAPTWVYPDTGTLIPSNLSILEFQWTPQGGTNLYEVAFSGNGVNLKIYTACNAVGGGCALTPDEPVWALLSTEARGQAVTVTLRATSGADVGTSASRTLRFADEDMTGGLYYWAASLGGLYRYDFGRRGQKGEPYYTPGQAGAMCVGCHALSRDGSRMAAGLNIPGPATMQILDVASKKVLFQLGNGFGIGSGSNYQTFTSNGGRIITTETGGLTMRDGANGNLIGANPQVPNANMPDVSPDDKAVVFSRGDPTCTIICQTLSSLNAGIFTVPIVNGGNAFGQVTQLVPINKGNETNFYPSFSPDGSYVVFNRAAKDSYDQMDARVMVVAAAGGKAPIDLKSLNAGGANSWPKWAPFAHHFGGSSILWVTFSSRRAYGLHGGKNSQIWMAAIDVNQLANGGDGAFPAFWLPFQDFASGNHIPGWANRVVRPPCSISHGVGCLQGMICVDDRCVPGP